MNQVSMNALNTGWSLGFGTSVPRQQSDLDLLVDHKLETDDVPAIQPSRFAKLAKAVATFAEEPSPRPPR
jgi:hypothetical protein